MPSAPKRRSSPAQNDRLRHLIRQLQRLQFGRRSEKLDPDQLNLALEDVEQAIADGGVALLILIPTTVFSVVGTLIGWLMGEKVKSNRSRNDNVILKAPNRWEFALEI